MCNSINYPKLNKLLLRSLDFEYINSRHTALYYGWVEPWHCSPWWVLTYCRSGKIEMQLGNPDGNYFVNTGDLSVIESERMVRGEVLSGDGAEIDWINFRFVAMDSIDLLSHFVIPNLISGETAVRLGEQIVAINKAVHDNPDMTTSAIVKKHAFMILELLLEKFSPIPDFNMVIEAHEHFKRVLDYIQDNYCKNIVCEKLAKLSGMSSATFFRNFRKCFGTTPHQYILSLRLKDARYLLLSDSITIGEIAETLGFCDQFQFSRIFRKHCGISPTLYRKRQRLR